VCVARAHATDSRNTLRAVFIKRLYLVYFSL
jgi:hypothetical protein